MGDPRINKLAKVLVQYSLGVQKNDQVVMVSMPGAHELNLAVAREVWANAGHIKILNQEPGFDELFYKLASDEQIDFISPIDRVVAETCQHYLVIGAEENTRELSGVDPQRQRRRRKARHVLSKIMDERILKKEMVWSYTIFPTQAYAQEADMSLEDYQDFVFGAELLDHEDPVAEWRKIGEEQQKICDWLKGKNKAVLKGPDIDLTLSFENRPFVNCCGRENFPDGEIFTCPLETSVNGWARFAYPAIYGGREVNNVELWFEEGRVVRHQAAKGEDFLLEMLNTDPGARYLGEWGIGTNYGIQRFSKNMLFDEKIGGTIHLALGESFPECGGTNESAIHWDLLCDMRAGEVRVDGDLFYQNGKVVV